MHLRARVIGFAGLLIASAFVPLQVIARAADASPALVLDFSSLDGRLKGNGWLVPGVSGQALQLDGIAAHVLVPAASVPRLTGSFPLAGWGALGAYPFNDAPILQQGSAAAGFFLGVGDRGQVRFDVTAGGRQLSVVSASR